MPPPLKALVSPDKQIPKNPCELTPYSLGDPHQTLIPPGQVADVTLCTRQDKGGESEVSQELCKGCRGCCRFPGTNYSSPGLVVSQVSQLVGSGTDRDTTTASIKTTKCNLSGSKALNSKRGSNRQGGSNGTSATLTFQFTQSCRSMGDWGQCSLI